MPNTVLAPAALLAPVPPFEIGRVVNAGSAPSSVKAALALVAPVPPFEIGRVVNAGSGVNPSWVVIVYEEIPATAAVTNFVFAAAPVLFPAT